MIGLAIRIGADLRFQPLVLALANIRQIDSIRSRRRRFVQLSDDARRKVVYQAWWLERGNTVTTLPISLTARLLGRKTQQQLSGCTAAIHMDGRITCGLSTVWKTGGDASIGLMRQIVSADDLALQDMVEHDMWDVHIIRNLIFGHDLRSAVP